MDESNIKDLTIVLVSSSGQTTSRSFGLLEIEDERKRRNSNMKSMTIIIIVAVSVANAQNSNVGAALTPVFDDVQGSLGQHSLRYVTENGISVAETGHFKPISGLTRVGANDYVYVKEGSYSFTSPEGQFYRVDYIADENGYRIKGSPFLPMTGTLLFLIAVACNNAAFVYKNVPILKFENNRNFDGQHYLNYVTGDGTSVSETGRFKPLTGITRTGENKQAYMTVVAFLAIAIAAVSAFPQFDTRFTPTLAGTKPIIPILQMDDVRDEAGQFSVRYVTGDGTTFAEVGKLNPTPEGSYVLVKEGSYEYKTPSGRTISLKYVADENGFQPVGDHLPVAPVA
ncbi:uncharacterized protein [Hetaerina americana]|uniref:uncharacterized protein n=1 Tax=Hetaerina americana TaxID=62018 RepID=UPI003A7F4258